MPAASLRSAIALIIAILDGEVRYSGPVRKFLRVIPVLRRFGVTYAELAASPGRLRQAVGHA